MKKQPIDTHPADQFMKALDGKIQPLFKEAHWEGMQALLNENFPKEEEPEGGVAKSDSRPETGAGKAINRFRWYFLGGVALIATLAATQWNVMAFQHSDPKHEIRTRENVNIQEERSTTGMGNTDKGTTESKSKVNTDTKANSKIQIMSAQEATDNAFDSDVLLLNPGQDQKVQQKANDDLINNSAIKPDSLQIKNQIEPLSDSASVRKRKFIFW